MKPVWQRILQCKILIILSNWIWIHINLDRELYKLFGNNFYVQVFLLQIICVRGNILIFFPPSNKTGHITLSHNRMWRYLVACIAATWLHYLASQLALKPRTRDLTGDKASPLRATRVCLIDWSFCPRHDASGWWICTAVSTTFTKLSPFWEANSHSARQEISRRFSEFHYRSHRSPAVDPTFPKLQTLCVFPQGSL